MSPPRAERAQRANATAARAGITFNESADPVRQVDERARIGSVQVSTSLYLVWPSPSEGEGLTQRGETMHIDPKLGPCLPSFDPEPGPDQAPYLTTKG